MAKITKTYDEILMFRQTAQNYINATPERSKLHYALEKTLKSTTRAWEDYADKENDIRVDCALLDDKKSFVHIDVPTHMGVSKQLSTDPAKAKDQQQKMRTLGRTEVEIDVYYATDLPEKLKAMWYQQFIGFVIDPEKDPISETVDKKE